MRISLFILITQFSWTFLSAQISADSIIADNEQYRATFNAEFADPDESPLTKEDLAEFSGIPFYPIDTNFYIVAYFELIESEPFEMKTTTARKPIYTVYGKATFVLDGDTIMLNIYQNQKLIEREEYRDYLFLPFTDLSNGEGSYPGGRYIDLRIPAGDSIVIDFNKSYNPYCAYNYKYSCPIPPPENHINKAITAGVKYH